MDQAARSQKGNYCDPGGSVVVWAGERWRSELNPHDWVLEEAEVLVQIVTMRSQHGFEIMVM